jgi:hypothetical protein
MSPLLLVMFLAASPADLPDPARIEALTGLKGTMDPKEGVFKVSAPRSDLAITAAGVKLNPVMGLTSWVAFQRVDGHTAAMGDLVLLEDQVNPVMSVALDAGLEVTALHNHFFWESPRVMFMHVGGMGEEEPLAKAVGKVFEAIRKTGTGPERVPALDIEASRSTLDPKRLEALLGVSGQLKDGVFRASWGRETRMHGHPVGAAMGVSTWAAFAGSPRKAVVVGDFAMREGELQDVLRTLRHAQINVVAIHQHMSGEEPRILFLHYWGVGPIEDLARGLKDALARTGIR